MQRKKASDFDPRILELYDGYVHGKMSKRQFLDHAAKYTLGGAAAVAVLDSLQPNYALAQQVPPDDPAIETEVIEYDLPEGTGTVKALLAKPAGATGPLPAVLVIHENRGLNPYIEDVVRRLGKAGYMAMGPDGLSSVGGYPGDDEKGRELQSSVDPAKLMEDFFAGYGISRPPAVDRQGRRRRLLLRRRRRQRAGGRLPGARRRRAVLRPPARRGGRSGDPGAAHAAVRRARRAGERRLAGLRGGAEGNGKTYEVYFYDGANHGFHNDTTPRYDAAAAELAWQRTLDFFGRHLGDAA